MNDREDETLAAPGGAATLITTQPEAAAVADVPVDAEFDSRYDELHELGRGGMGRVLLEHDARIGREVAMKLVRAELAEHGGVQDRFLREAQLQGRLEHPAIVPVYDVGRTPSGALYFTMKRVRGVTLEHVLGRLRAGDVETARTYGRRKLLTAFDQVCLAIHFAHGKGVLHRDLKPANVMFGDFGEVYVLDWGIARDANAQMAKTGVRGIVGTPGYLAPEQTRGLADVRSDVYALGTILFELLALGPLHTGGGVIELLESTRTGADVAARARALGADLPPELEAIVVRATALDPAARYPTAHDLHQALERFLEGDRDLELRGRLAAEHARAAAEAIAGGADDAARARAMEQAGRALALDPRNELAAATVARLLLEPPRDTPREVADELVELDRRTVRYSGRVGALAYSGWLLALPLLLWAGVREPGWLAVMVLSAAAAVALSIWSSQTRIAHAPLTVTTLVLSGIAIVATGRLFGPLIMVPALAIVNGLPLIVLRPMSPVRWWVITGLGFGAFVVAAALELSGLVAPSYVFADGVIQIMPNLIELSPVPTWAVLALGTVTAIWGPAFSIENTRRELVEAQRRLALQAWHLRHLVPRASPPA